MKVKLMGIGKFYEFTNNNGEVIRGRNIFCAFENENVDGYKTEKFSIKPEIRISECKTGDTIDLSFNMKGKVEAINKA